MYTAATPRRSTRHQSGSREVTPVAHDVAASGGRESSAIRDINNASTPAIRKKTTSAYGTTGRAQSPEDRVAADQNFSSAYGTERVGTEHRIPLDTASTTGSRPGSRSGSPNKRPGRGERSLPATIEEENDEDDGEAAANTTSQLAAPQTPAVAHVHDPTTIELPRQSLFTQRNILLGFLLALFLALFCALASFGSVYMFSSTRRGAQFMDSSSAIAAAMAAMASTATPDITSPPTRAEIILHNEAYKTTFKNWFGIYNGARVDPFLSSPSLYWWIQSDDPYKFTPLSEPTLKNGPSTALMPTSEAGDCWCTNTEHVDIPQDPKAAENPFYHFEAQLAIELPRAIAPFEIVLEHMPPENIDWIEQRATPMDVEVWVQLGTAFHRDIVWEKALENPRLPSTIPDRDAPPRRRSFWQWRWAHFLDALGYKKMAPVAAEMALSEAYVRISTFSFNATARNWLQVFPMDVQLFDFGGYTNKVVLRVTSNHGWDFYTCFYRVYLNGAAME